MMAGGTKTNWATFDFILAKSYHGGTKTNLTTFDYILANSYHGETKTNLATFEIHIHNMLYFIAMKWKTWIGQN